MPWADARCCFFAACLAWRRCRRRSALLRGWVLPAPSGGRTSPSAAGAIGLAGQLVASCRYACSSSPTVWTSDAGAPASLLPAWPLLVLSAVAIASCTTCCRSLSGSAPASVSDSRARCATLSSTVRRNSPASCLFTHLRLYCLSVVVVVAQIVSACLTAASSTVVMGAAASSTAWAAPPSACSWPHSAPRCTSGSVPTWEAPYASCTAVDMRLVSRSGAARACSCRYAAMLSLNLISSHLVKGVRNLVVAFNGISSSEGGCTYPSAVCGTRAKSAS